MANVARIANTIEPSLSYGSIKEKCPKCGIEYKHYSELSTYCPACGIPMHIQKLRFRIGGLRIDGEKINQPIGKNYKRCFDCGSINYLSAKYCRVCGAPIEKHAIDTEDHEWVDLGLSVIWAGQNLKDLYRWKDSIPYKRFETLRGKELGDVEKDWKKVDTASMEWKDNWRMPTKDEFQELIDKCKWEKAIKYTNDYRKKIITGFNIIGPSGASMFLPTSLRKFYFAGIGIDGSDYSLFEGHYLSSTQEDEFTAYGLEFWTIPRLLHQEVLKFKPELLRFYSNSRDLQYIEKILNSQWDRMDDIDKLLGKIFGYNYGGSIDLANRIVEDLWMRVPSPNIFVEKHIVIENEFASIRPVRNK